MSLSAPTAEEFRPISVRINPGIAGRIAFALRCLVDLQLHSIWKFLGPRLQAMSGDVLDVGCGEMPFRAMLPKDVRYTGIDVPEAIAFGMRSHPEIRTFDGRTFPFPDASFDHVICTEVLEHAEYPQDLIDEMRRVLRPGGTVVATVPFSARVHYLPHDYHRFTHVKLARMFEKFAEVAVTERGNDLAVIANKLIVIAMRLLKPSWRSIWRLPALILLAPVAAAFLLLAHISMACGFGVEGDPLGYAILARRP